VGHGKRACHVSVKPVNGYMISGMLTRGKNCETAVCSRSFLKCGGDAVYPPTMVAELESNVGDFLIDCARMPAAKDFLDTKSQPFTNGWRGYPATREQQRKLFDYLLTEPPDRFTFLVQSARPRGPLALSYPAVQRGL